MPKIRLEKDFRKAVLAEIEKQNIGHARIQRSDMYQRSEPDITGVCKLNGRRFDIELKMEGKFLTPQQRERLFKWNENGSLIALWTYLSDNTIHVAYYDTNLVAIKDDIQAAVVGLIDRLNSPYPNP